MKQYKATHQSADLSIIITAHHEGLFLHKTLLSVFKSISNLPNTVRTEVLISLDNPDEETLRIATEWSDRATLATVSFGNPADNRNSAIASAAGRYIALLDGDDLVSCSWFATAYSLLQTPTEPTVIRPELHVQFSYDDPNLYIWRMRDSSNKATDAIQMAYWNLWTNCLVTTKEILLKHPYKPSLNGFGFEDYLFCTHLINSGVRQKIAPKTALFYRHRPGSTSTAHINTVLDYSPLFAIDYMKQLPLAQGAKPNRSLSTKVRHHGKRAYRFIYDTARKIDPINRRISPLARSILYKKNLSSGRIQQWFINELRNINAIENQLYPTQGVIAQAQFHPLSLHPFDSRFGIIYQKLCHMLSENGLDYLFLAPSMSGRGGTEKLIANYIIALRKLHPTWRIGILSTQPFNSATIDYFSKLRVDMIDFGALTCGIGDYEKNIIWSRFLIQTGVKRLHLVNDEYWYRWMAHHKILLKENNFKVYVSLFMREYTHEKDRVLGFSDPHLAAIWPVVTKVFTDNHHVIAQALENNAFHPEKLITHYQPEDDEQKASPRLIERGSPVRILWASRISFQKRPDILKRIAKKLNDNYKIDAYGIIDTSQISRTFFNGSRVSYKGGFHGIKSIDTSKYDIYLYTSQTDGIPNILMEVSEAGLPIIASDIGGIAEFVKHKKTGMLVDLEDIDGYINAIELYANNPTYAKKMATNSQKLLRSQHSWNNFIQQIARDIS